MDKSFNAALLKSRFQEFGLLLTAEQLECFKVYHRELLEWNSRANLISNRDENRILDRHFLESAILGSLPEVGEGMVVLDLGTGGGFPGIPLKIVRPDLNLTLIDSRRRKTLFLKNLIKKISLPAEVVLGRTENLGEKYLHKYELVVTRAVSDLVTLVLWSKPLLVDFGKVIAIKGSSVLPEKTKVQKRFSELSVRIQPHPLKSVSDNLNIVIIE